MVRRRPQTPAPELEPAVAAVDENTATIAAEQPVTQEPVFMMRGPTSALSSFLRERGIRVPSQTRYQRIPVSEQFNPPTEEDEKEAPETIVVAPQSEDFIPLQATATLNRFPAASKKKAPESSEDDLPKAAKKKSKLRPMQEDGIVQFCKICDRRFAMANQLQMICHACMNVNGASKKENAAQKRALKKAQVAVLETTGGHNGSILPLRDLCIKMIVDNIGIVEYIADCPVHLKLKISQILSKQRKLDSASMELFLGPDEDVVELYDCTRLDESALMKIPELAPEIEVLRLGFCGRITDKVLEKMGRLEKLTELYLSGAFLCSPGGFAGLFQSLGNLKKVELDLAAKLTNESLEYLARECPQLSILSLTDCPFIDNDGILHIATLNRLSSLSLNSLGAVQDESLAVVLSKIGSTLSRLSLNKQSLITDAVLENISTHCIRLDSLSLQHCPLLTSESLTDMFSLLNPLTALALAGNNTLQDGMVKSIAQFHGKQLADLNLNGLDELTVDGLAYCSDSISNLRKADFSWIRSVDDQFFAAFMQSSRELENVSVFGCNQLSVFTLNRVWMNDRGRQIVLKGNEFD